jgi:ABC-type bacteriocin/lantibiotic exporter with double-glycine peptidase domain
MQDTAANCGPASLSNALQAIGISRTQAECEQLCRTTGTAGTNYRGLQAAIKSVGRVPEVLNERRADVALSFLRNDLRSGRAAVLCVDLGEHWVAAVGLIGERILIADPADNELVMSLSGDQLKTRWAHANRYYGVIV